MTAADAPGGASRGVVFEPVRLREGFVVSLALVPSVFVYGSVFGGLAVQAGLRPALGLGDPQLWGAVVVFVLAALRVNMLACVAVGVGLVAVLRAWAPLA